MRYRERDGNEEEHSLKRGRRSKERTVALEREGEEGWEGGLRGKRVDVMRMHQTRRKWNRQSSKEAYVQRKERSCWGVNEGWWWMKLVSLQIQRRLDCVGCGVGIAMKEGGERIQSSREREGRSRKGEGRSLRRRFTEEGGWIKGGSMDRAVSAGTEGTLRSKRRM